jgi:hypothetical protein
VSRGYLQVILPVPMRDVLSALEHDCAGTGDVRTCPIIEALSDAPELDDLPAPAGKTDPGSLL